MIGRQLKTGLYAGLALAGGLALRLWFVAHAARIAGDTLLYGNIARNWMQHGVYSFTPWPSVPVPTLIRLPGYPLFLMACFSIFGVENYTAVMYVQCLIDLCTCLLIAALVRRLFGQRAAMAALWLSALCPFMAIYTAAPLTEVLTPNLYRAYLLWSGALAQRRDRLQPVALDNSGCHGVCGSAAAGARAARRFGYSGDGVDGLADAGAKALTVENVSAGRARRTLRRCFRWCPGRCGTGVPFMSFSRLRRVTRPIPAKRSRWAFSVGIAPGPIDFASTEEVYWNYDSAPVEIGDLPARAFDSNDQYARTEAILGTL